MKTGTPIHPDIAAAVQKIMAFSEVKAFQQLVSRYEQSESEQERMILAVSFGCVPYENMDAAVKYVLEKMPARLQFVPLRIMAANPALAPHLWEMFLRHRIKLEKIPSVHFERILIGIISIGGLEAPREVREFFPSYAPPPLKTYHKHLRETMDTALEMLEAFSAFRARCR
jgi:hypothetical protein